MNYPQQVSSPKYRLPQSLERRPSSYLFAIPLCHVGIVEKLPFSRRYRHVAINLS